MRQQEVHHSNPTIVTEYLEKERRMGHVIGHLKREVWPAALVNCFGVISINHLNGGKFCGPLPSKGEECE